MAFFVWFFRKNILDNENEDYYQRCTTCSSDGLLAGQGSVDIIEKHNHEAQSANGSLAVAPDTIKEQESDQTVGPYPNCTHHTTGLFSTIYKTTQSTSTGPKTLAIKLTTPSQCQPPHDPKREARLFLAAKHPNIIPLLETHSLSSSHFLLVFPFQPLDLDILLRKQTLIRSQAHTIINDLFSALAHLHSLGIIHRDVKPSNILLASSSGPAYLADFGIAWSPTDPASEPADEKITDVGTTCYRPPELLFGQRAYSHAIDLWAAGCVTAEIVHATTVQAATGKKGGWTLFDAGELGSELALVKSIFETLGTPTEESWPEANTLPDWNKMSFISFPAKPWATILPNVSTEARDLVSKLVRYQSTERMQANCLGKVPFQGLLSA